jgi:crotonobetainyl-CoA:carnitine CoA-transferase CaiB-like acyl-CoA transferase
LVVTSISDFGQSGPYRDFQAEEIQLEALSGMMHLTGQPGRPPLAAGSAICQYSGGLHAYVGTLMALFAREEHGAGEAVDIALLDCGLENVEIALSNHLQRGTQPRRGPNPMVPWGLYECRDGWGSVVCMPQRHWNAAGTIFDEPRLSDGKFAHVIDRMMNREEYEGLLAPRVKEHTRAELFEEGQRHGLAFGYLASLAEAVALPQLEATGFFEPVEHPVAGRHGYAGAPFRMETTPWRSARAPLLGEHTREILGEHHGLGSDELESLAREGIV